MSITCLQALKPHFQILEQVKPLPTSEFALLLLLYWNLLLLAFAWFVVFSDTKHVVSLQH